MRCFGSDPVRVLHVKSSQPSFPSLPDGPGWAQVSPHAFSPWDMGLIFCGYWCLYEFPPWGNPGCRCLQRRQRAARHHLSPQAFSERLAWRPAAFHCCLFIRINSLRFLSCSLRGTQGELVPADGPHPLHPALLERGLEKRDGGEGVSPTPPGPRVPPACCFPANTVSVQPKNVSLIS